MSDIKKTSHTIGKIKQLVDLNGDTTNFDLSFTVTCRDDTPFNLLVVDQSTLDNTPELTYKEVNGTISGNIVADKNIYQNYFLILKSDKTCIVDVERTLKVLPRTPDSVELTNNNPPSHEMFTNGSSESTNWKKIGLIAFIIISGICILWWLYKQKRSSENSQTDVNNPSTFDSSTPIRNQSPLQSSLMTSPTKPDSVPSQVGDSRKFNPTQVLSPDVMSQGSVRSSNDGDVGNSLLYRLRKFAR
jgi:hypothetical protein